MGRRRAARPSLPTLRVRRASLRGAPVGHAQGARLSPSFLSGQRLVPGFGGVGATSRRSTEEDLIAPCAAISIAARRTRSAADLAALRATLVASPGPSAAVLRRAFATDGARVASIRDRHAALSIARIADIHHGGDADEVLDVYRPEGTDSPLAAVVRVHGGGRIGGAKEQLGECFRILAACGEFVTLRTLLLAPEHRHPESVREMVSVPASIAREQPARVGGA